MSCSQVGYLLCLVITLPAKNVKKFDDLKSLLVANYIKDMLSPDCFKQILAVENTEKEG